MRKTKATQMLFLLLGLGFVGIALLGVFLPVLPTTPFLIIALACFSRSSQRLHDWLYHHPLFGPTLQSWHQYQVIPPFIKVVAVTAMGISFIFMILMTDTPLVAVVCVALLMGYGGWYILSKPSTPPVQETWNERR
ncbi:MAG: YbaN family protein [Magnetococcales bacterium]|nr:YbaN family protein [Magnetococcales bacterium]